MREIEEILHIDYATNRLVMDLILLMIYPCSPSNEQASDRDSSAVRDNELDSKCV